ncbi:MAG: VOC family protein [Flavobacteriaceae bacterium]|jgi:PhnB protein|nr:VOC family protein [Flavobacteriaceae bacterium]
MATTNTYLTFDGNCEEAFNFYKSVFGGEFMYIGRFGEIPSTPEFTIPEEDKNKIMHVSLPIGQSILMGSDTSCGNPNPVIQGNNFSVSVATDTQEEADDLFAKLAIGGTVIMPIEDMFWGDYFGMILDKFGIQWMVNFSRDGQY